MYQKARYMFYVPKGYVFRAKWRDNEVCVAPDDLTMYMNDDNTIDDDGVLHMDKVSMGLYSDAIRSVPSWCEHDKKKKPLVLNWKSMKVMREVRQEHYDDYGVWMQIRKVDIYNRLMDDKIY